MRERPRPGRCFTCPGGVVLSAVVLSELVLSVRLAVYQGPYGPMLFRPPPRPPRLVSSRIAGRTSTM